MEKHSIVGIIGVIFAIFSIICFMSIFILGINILFFVAIISSILSIIFGTTAYWGKYKDKLGLADFVIGVVVLAIWLITAIYVYMAYSVTPMYGTPLYRPKVK